MAIVSDRRLEAVRNRLPIDYLARLDGTRDKKRMRVGKHASFLYVLKVGDYLPNDHHVHSLQPPVPGAA